ncbi:MAG: hypothetical protein ACXV5H_12425 [Halobacteriota archaeon]
MSTDTTIDELNDARANALDGIEELIEGWTSMKNVVKFDTEFDRDTLDSISNLVEYFAEQLFCSSIGFELSSIVYPEDYEDDDLFLDENIDGQTTLTETI